MFQSNAFQNYAFQTMGSGSSPAPTPIVGGHFIPAKHTKDKKRTLSNVLTVYKKAKELPRAETKELRDTISKFVEPSIARKPIVPEFEKINYEDLTSNDTAYEKFSNALSKIQERLDNMNSLAKEKSKPETEEDDELLLTAIIACMMI